MPFERACESMLLYLSSHGEQEQATKEQMQKKRLQEKKKRFDKGQKM